MNIHKLVRAAIIAALYVVLCVILAPLAYGTVQIRFSEALTLLPVLLPEAVVGVTVGCFIANIFSGTPIDMVVGTLATLLAALATRKIRGMRWKGLALPASLPPILFNAVIVGIELTLLYTPGAAFGVYFLNMASVGAGQVVSCGILGVLLVLAIEKNPALYRLVTGQRKAL